MDQKQVGFLGSGAAVAGHDEIDGGEAAGAAATGWRMRCRKACTDTGDWDGVAAGPPESSSAGAAWTVDAARTVRANERTWRRAMAVTPCN